MPVEELASWSGGRWVKKIGGKQYRQSVAQLRETYPQLVTADNKAGSIKAANQWVRDLQATATPKAKPENRDQRLIDTLSQASRIHAQEEDYEQVVKNRDLTETIAEWTSIAGQADLPEHVLDAVERQELVVLKHATEATKTSLRCDAQVALFLASKKVLHETGDFSAGHLDNLRAEVTTFCNWFRPSRSVEEIRGAIFLDYFNSLKSKTKKSKDNPDPISVESAKRAWGTAKNFIKFLFQTEAIENLPRNFLDKSLKFEVKAKTVQGWTKEEAQFAVTNAGEPLKLYLLLCLNCGMYQTDIAELQHSEVDWRNGIITRARSKTRDRSDKVPTVSWKLWPETFKLLKKHRSKDPVLVLTNEDGKPLKTERIRGEDEAKAGKFSKIDNIASAYYRLQKKHPEQSWKQLKELRKTGSILMQKSPRYTSCREIFLGHTPKTLADKSYGATPQELMDEAVAWLGEQLGFDR